MMLGSWLPKAQNSLANVVTPISRLSSGIGGGILFLLMLLTTCDVLLRYLFNAPIDGTFELTEYAMVFIVSLGLAYCAINKGHTAVELVIGKLPEKSQAIINSITYLVSMVFVALITWRLVIYAFSRFESKMTSSVLLIPSFPFIIILTIGCLLFCLALITVVFEYISKVAKR
jgi:TRAP-type C4-dicarboxylate transport system permease small subunit